MGDLTRIAASVDSSATRCAAAILDALGHDNVVVVRGVRDAAMRAALLAAIARVIAPPTEAGASRAFPALAGVAGDAGPVGDAARPGAVGAGLLRGARITEACGDGLSHGYLAGFEPLLLNLLAAAERQLPDLVARHEQSLKRIWPARPSPAFRVPRDLTNTADRAERTRFYHHEYQNKLLFGLAEFALDALAAMDVRHVLVVSAGDRLSPTARSFVDILRRIQTSDRRLLVVLLDEAGSLIVPDAPVLDHPSLTRAEFEALSGIGDRSPGQRALLFARSGGVPSLGAALAVCAPGRLSATDRLSVEAIIDLHLATLPPARLRAMGEAYVAAGCEGGPIERRNAATLSPGSLDDAHAAAHEAALARYRAGEGPLVLRHALAIRDRGRRLDALVEPSEILMGIGLYDTWFGYFAEIFGDADLRGKGSGDDPGNGLFINAAFVLYAMGYAASALPFLETFLVRFPASRFVPTALYAQSMTYGRYQLPVDLPRAEACARRNLAVIEAQFADHPRHVYIKVFAENAYAYIKARQGLFDEALALCESGIAEILAAYGPEPFQLHRSILIYNTGQVYELVGDWIRAEERLRDAIACDPFYGEYHNDLGNLLARLPGRADEALAAYQRAIDLSPPYYEAHLNRGLLRAELGDADGAAADFHRALAIKPSEWRALKELGNLNLAASDPGAALAAYDAALQLDAVDADLQANAALAAAELGLGDRALRHGEAALALNPRHAGAHTNLAAERLRRGDLDDALAHARQAAEHGDDPDFLANLRAIEQLCASRAAGTA